MKIDKEKLIQMKREGKSNRECAKAFGCQIDSVRKMCYRLEAAGLLPPSGNNAEDYIAEIHLQTDSEEPASLPTVAERLAVEEENELAQSPVGDSLKCAVRIEQIVPDDEICYEPTDLPVGSYAEVVHDLKLDWDSEATFPIPPIDRKTFWGMRRDELRSAICDYACEGLRVDPEWVDEYNELIERCKE